MISLLTEVVLNTSNLSNFLISADILLCVVALMLTISTDCLHTILDMAVDEAIT